MQSSFEAIFKECNDQKNSSLHTELILERKPCMISSTSSAVIGRRECRKCSLPPSTSPADLGEVVHT